MYDCAYCYETFENREDVIHPCPCDGSMKYLCKTCLNSNLEFHKTDEQYYKCVNCGNKYVRDYGNIPKSVQDRATERVVINFLYLLIFVGGIFMTTEYLNPGVLLFLMFILFIMAECLLEKVGERVIYLVMVISLIIGIFNSSARAPFCRMYAFAIFMIFLSILLTSGLENAQKEEISKYMQCRKFKMFDLELNRYVDGII